MGLHDFLIRKLAVAGQKILPLDRILRCRFADGCIERAIACHQPRIDRGHIRRADAEPFSDENAILFRKVLPRAVIDEAAQAPEVEEEGFMRGGRAGAHNRPVAEDVVLNGRANPPGRISREADTALRFEASRCLHQADIAFLDKVAIGKTVVAETRRKRDHEPHIGACQLMQGVFVLVLFPAPGEVELAALVQKRHRHRALHVAAIGPLRFRSVHMYHPFTPSSYGAQARPDHAGAAISIHPSCCKNRRDGEMFLFFP